MIERQADVVQPMVQALLVEGVHVKAKGLATRWRQGLAQQVHLDLQGLGAGGQGEEPIDPGRVKDDRQDAVLEAIVEKDVGVSWGPG
jgi:hypothetical protein